MERTRAVEAAARPEARRPLEGAWRASLRICEAIDASKANANGEYLAPVSRLNPETVWLERGTVNRRVPVLELQRRLLIKPKWPNL